MLNAKMILIQDELVTRMRNLNGCCVVHSKSISSLRTLRSFEIQINSNSSAFISNGAFTFAIFARDFALS
jgi:hypothetical protein